MKFLLRPGLFSVAFALSLREGKHNQVTLKRLFHGIFTFTLPETNISPLNIGHPKKETSGVPFTQLAVSFRGKRVMFV